MIVRANQARADELSDNSPREEPFVEIDVEDQEGDDIEE